MITRCYFEITNVCNLNCLFCPKTEREKRLMTLEDFHTLTDKLVGKIKFLYLHLMGEPFLHPLLPQFIRVAREKGFIPVLTTNGTLLAERHDLLDALPHKIQISLHSHEGNHRSHLETYIQHVVGFAKEAAQRGCIIVLRLWNEGGYNQLNEEIMQLIARELPQPWESHKESYKLADHLFLEHDQMFEWPAMNHEMYADKEVFCYALRNQIDLLVDGTVVPCCLDYAGSLALGNLFEQSLDEILSSTRARSIYEGFTRHTAVEPLCQRCGYSHVAKHYRKQ